jgi:tetratricopeptide (TPR) repeat protein
MVGRRTLLIAGSIALLIVTLLIRVRHDRGSSSVAAPTATTSRADLARTVKTMTARLDDEPADTTAAVALAEALLRLARVDNDPSAAVRAERALRRALDGKPHDYLARRELGAVLLSQHRFREAIAEASAARVDRPDDVWNDGVLGDAHLELGEYEQAFDAFDRMVAKRPSAAAYARVSYTRELQGDRDGAIRLMAMSLEATSASDPESQAWHEVHLGQLLLDTGDGADAKQHFERAEFLFPDYGPAIEGRVRVLKAEGRLEDALALASDQLSKHQTGALAVVAGDLARALGRLEDAERFYQSAEYLLRYEPAALALFLAEHDRDIPRAVDTAKAAVSIRRDIFTEDALAWALFKHGDVSDARQAIERAMRTGSRDRQIQAHAHAIRSKPASPKP